MLGYKKRSNQKKCEHLRPLANLEPLSVRDVQQKIAGLP